jgi:hypothetical protein
MDRELYDDLKIEAMAYDMRGRLQSISHGRGRGFQRDRGHEMSHFERMRHLAA